MEKQKKPLTSEDFQRIHDVANSIIIWGMDEIKVLKKADLYKSCYMFNTIGAFILQEHYGINAIPHVGLAVFCAATEEPKEPAVSEKPSILNFTFCTDAENLTTENGRHCWVETEDGWIIDFMSPYFKERAEAFENFPQNVVKSKDFIKHKSEMLSLEDFGRPGDFFVFTDGPQSLNWAVEIADNPIIEDLVTVAAAWFTKPSKEIMQEITTLNDAGESVTVKFRHNPISGSW